MKSEPHQHAATGGPSGGTETFGVQVESFGIVTEKLQRTRAVMHGGRVVVLASLEKAIVNCGHRNPGRTHDVDQLDFAMITRLVATGKPAAMNTDQQWRRLATLCQPKVKPVALVRPVNDIRMRGLDYWSIGLPLLLRLLERLRLGKRQHAVLIGISLWESLENAL